jgi:hypothetical protein
VQPPVALRSPARAGVVRVQGTAGLIPALAGVVAVLAYRLRRNL